MFLISFPPLHAHEVRTCSCTEVLASACTACCTECCQAIKAPTTAGDLTFTLTMADGDSCEHRDGSATSARLSITPLASESVDVDHLHESGEWTHGVADVVFCGQCCA